MKIRSYMLQAIKREMIFNQVQRLMCLHSGVSVPSTVSVGQGEAAQWARPWALDFRAGKCSSSCFTVPFAMPHSSRSMFLLSQWIWKCISSGTEPHPAHLPKQLQLSNMSGNSTLKVPLQLLGNRKVWHRNNSWLSANIEAITALTQLKQEHEQHP